MFGLGAQELLLIFLIALFLFGSKKLPEIGAGLGKGIKAFKQGLRDMDKDTEDEPKKLEDHSKEKLETKN